MHTEKQPGKSEIIDMKIKQRIFEIIQAAKPDDRVSRIFDISLMALILLNVCLVIADTFTLTDEIKAVLSYIEFFSVIVFTAEYILRLWTADLLFPEEKKFRARMKYGFSFLAVIDLLAIVPFYLPFIIPIDLRVLRMLRIIRLFRIFKFTRYTDALTKILKVFKDKKHELLSSIFVVLLLMIIAAVLMYNIENTAQPDVFNNAFDSLWWALATLTTVGYGDIYPVTALGKILSAVIAILGIGLVAVPTGIISAGFIESISEKDTKEIKYCPHCGEKLE